MTALILAFLLSLDDFEPDCWDPNLETETSCVAEGWCER